MTAVATSGPLPVVRCLRHSSHHLASCEDCQAAMTARIAAIRAALPRPR